MNRVSIRHLALGLLSIALSSPSSFALPVLRESAGDFNSGFVTIYPDHRDKNLFYFLPNQIRFSQDQSTKLPTFSLQTYGAEQNDLSKIFGYMSFVFRPGLSEDVQSELKKFADKNPGARLAPLPVGESYLTIGQSRDGTPSVGANQFFQHWDLPPFGGLLETEVGGNAYLTGLGAKMMTNAIKSSVPVVLNSCYTVDGVSPYMDATVKINYSKVFEHFKSMARVGWWIYGGSISKEVSRLQESGAMSIEVHGDTQFEDVVMEMARDLAKQYMVPTLANNTSDVSLQKTPFRFVQFAWGSVTVEERKEVTLLIKKQTNIQDVRCIAAPFSGLKQYADEIVQNTPMGAIQ